MSFTLKTVASHFCCFRFLFLLPSLLLIIGVYLFHDVATCVLYSSFHFIESNFTYRRLRNLFATNTRTLTFQPVSALFVRNVGHVCLTFSTVFADIPSQRLCRSLRVQSFGSVHSTESATNNGTMKNYCIRKCLAEVRCFSFV